MDASILSGETKPSKKHKLIEIKPANKGKLHKKLGVKKGKKLTVAEEEKAAHSDSPAERKEAQFALNARKWKK
jgi:hypothetical protein